MALHIRISVGRVWHFDIGIAVKMTTLSESVASCKPANKAGICTLMRDTQGVENAVRLCSIFFNSLIYIVFIDFIE